jgi:16S rRNA processing protein RimM
MQRATADAPRGAHLPDPDSWVEIGEVLRPHGLDGGLLVCLYGDDPQNLIDAGRVRLQGTPGSIEFRVRRVVTAGSTPGGRARVRLWVAALESRDQAVRWKGVRVSIPAEALKPLPEGEYYWREVLGLRCRTLEGEDLGSVAEIWPTATNDLLVVRKGERTVLVPTLRHVLVRVDLERREIWIDASEGLVEDGG